MSLKISNKLTEKQRKLLVSLDYTGTWDLTVQEASKVIDELLIEQGLTHSEILGVLGEDFEYPNLEGKFTD